MGADQRIAHVSRGTATDGQSLSQLTGARWCSIWPKTERAKAEFDRAVALNKTKSSGMSTMGP